MKKNSEASRFYRICYAVFAKIVGLIFRIKVINAENEPDEGGFLVCANHVSATDAVVICYAFRKHQIRLMAKKELFKIPLLSGLIKMLGAFPVDRSGSDVGAIRKAVDMLREGKCVGMFPQGHRYPCEDPRTTPRKNGAALICTRAEADVFPVYIWRKNNKAKLFRRTYVILGERIPFESFGYTEGGSAEYKRITDIAFGHICDIGEAFDPKELKKK
ncbi:MAG: 1-acyl-sn-glycerol-3-phosphate acyltransferase [Clostridia bacterium]|nr:1-acyl-sn-glycerol-3-phosphate acyltransferase [Clostridia bacterium]